MSSPSPVTDGKHVWVMTGVGILKSFDFAGKEIWSRDIQTDYGRFGLNWGYASSPLLHENALYVQVLHGMKTDDPPYVMKIDAASGKTMWKVERPTDAQLESPDSYTTPALLRYGGKTEIIITGGDVVTGHDPATGKELWRADILNPQDNRNYRIVASPVIAGGLIHRAQPQQPARRAPARRLRRRLDEPRRVDVRARPGRADARQRRHLRLCRRRHRRRLLPRAQDGQCDLRTGAAAARNATARRPSSPTARST